MLRSSSSLFYSRRESSHFSPRIGSAQRVAPDNVFFISMSIRHILTHPGGAHKDEFLACCLLAHVHQTSIVRREPTEADLLDPSVCVVDVGGEHLPERLNFDHHQFPKNHPPSCSLTLVLQHLGIYEDARLF